jgi:hypothetical protein
MGIALCFGHFLDRTVDHGLPLVHLKEERRNLIIALMGRKGPIDKEKLLEIAAIQQAIAAMEAVIADLLSFSSRCGPLAARHLID